jgi:hypothetical protein
MFYVYMSLCHMSYVIHKGIKGVKVGVSGGGIERVKRVQRVQP